MHARLLSNLCVQLRVHEPTSRLSIAALHQPTTHLAPHVKCVAHDLSFRVLHIATPVYEDVYTVSHLGHLKPPTVHKHSGASRVSRHTSKAVNKFHRV